MDRLRLDAKLKELAPNVYFQPRSNVSMDYPCIRYEAAPMDSKFAGNKPYRLTERYTVTVIDRDPDSVIPKMVASLPMSSHSAFFIRDNLNHHVFNVFI